MSFKAGVETWSGAWDLPFTLWQHWSTCTFGEVHSKAVAFSFRLWWQYNWSNIFFQRIINSYWSLRGCHVHLSTCHSRDTGAANLWRTHLVFLLSHINMKLSWLKRVAFWHFSGGEQLRSLHRRHFTAEPQGFTQHWQGSGLRGTPEKFLEVCRCCLRKEY